MIDPTVMFANSYGLYVLSSGVEGEGAACIVNTVTQVTAEPIQLIVSVNKENGTCKAIEETGHFAVVVLDETADMPFIGRFGFRRSADFKKFEGIPFEVDALGDPYPVEHGCAGYTCEVRNAMDAGSHMVFLAEVVETRKMDGAKPMTYAFYHGELRGKTPAKAASYVAEQN